MDMEISQLTVSNLLMALLIPRRIFLTPNQDLEVVTNLPRVVTNQDLGPSMAIRILLSTTEPPNLREGQYLMQNLRVQIKEARIVTHLTRSLRSPAMLQVMSVDPIIIIPPKSLMLSIQQVDLTISLFLLSLIMWEDHTTRHR